MLPLTLIPLSESVMLESLTEEEDHFLLKLATNSFSGTCPDCKKESCSRHSAYQRRLLDLPWAGIAVRVDLSVKKFYCKNEQCRRKIFTERLGEKLLPFARRTSRLNEHLNRVGYALGGTGGSKLASFIGVPISSSTMLRIIRKVEPDVETSTPRVLGIDDWAFRKGHNYGTILVDLEKRKPIDLLPDRDAETVKKWLEDHPGVEIISRDRASCYALGAKQGAPQAIQVADRWHLLKNLGEALKRMLDKHNKELRQAAKEIAEVTRAQENKGSEVKEENPVKPQMAVVSTEKKQKPTRFELNFLEVKRLKSEGHSIKSIHRQTGVHRQTIKKYLKYEKYPGIAISATKASSALPFEPYLRKRWGEGETNHKQLWREIKEEGFAGSSQSVYRLVCKYPKDKSVENLPPPLTIKVWSARKVSNLMSQPFEKLEKESQEFLRGFYKICPQANKASQLARKFKEMTAKLRRKKLDPWVNSALESGIPAMKNFAKGLQQDYDAVKAAVSLKWSNGQVEGQVNRLKNIKRQMYGRASFELLRKRVLMDSG